MSNTTSPKVNEVSNEEKAQKPMSRMTRFWRWLCDTDKLEAESRHMEEQFAQFADRNRSEKLEKMKQAMRRDIYAQCIAAWTPENVAATKPSEAMHQKAMIVAERAATAYMAKTYGPY